MKTKPNLSSPYTSAAIFNHKELTFLIGGLNVYIGTDLEPLIAEMANKLLRLYENATGVEYPNKPTLKEISA